MKKLVVVCGLAAFAVFAVAGSVHAEAGISATWSGGGNFSIGIPIKMQSGMVIEPSLAFAYQSTGDPVQSEGLAAGITSYGDGTVFGPGIMIDVPFGNANAITPSFGGGANVWIESPDLEGADSRTDFAVFGFVGGAAEIAEHMEVVVRTGVEFYLTGEQNSHPSVTEIYTWAHIGVRAFIFGI